MRNPARISGRVGQLTVNGKPVPGTLLPLAPPGAVVRVEAVVTLPG